MAWNDYFDYEDIETDKLEHKLINVTLRQDLGEFEAGRKFALVIYDFEAMKLYLIDAESNVLAAMKMIIVFAEED